MIESIRGLTEDTLLRKIEWNNYVSATHKGSCFYLHAGDAGSSGEISKIFQVG